MSTALVVTTGLGGNIPPMLGIATELRRRGWNVIVHSDDPVTQRAQQDGFDAVLADAVDYDPLRHRSTLTSLRDVPRLWADRSRGRDAVTVAKRVDADVALVDVLLVGALSELEAAGIPTVAVAHSSWEGVRLWLGPPLGVLCRFRGAAPKEALQRATAIAVVSDPRLGRPIRLPENAELTGPVLEEIPPARRPRDRPLLLLTLSTVAFPGQHKAFQRLLDAVSELPVDVIAGTGEAIDPAGLRVGANTELQTIIDHAALMPEASVVITHGGHATTVRALAHRVPILFVPMHPMMDQPKIARAVATADAGLVVSKKASPERTRAAIRRLLDEPSFTRRAGEIGAEMIAADGVGRVADVVSSVAGAAC
ncbi:glycosyltransferase [Gordonia sp. NPDC003425]